MFLPPKSHFLEDGSFYIMAILLARKERYCVQIPSDSGPHVMFLSPKSHFLEDGSFCIMAILLARKERYCVQIPGWSKRFSFTSFGVHTASSSVDKLGSFTWDKVPCTLTWPLSFVSNLEMRAAVFPLPQDKLIFKFWLINVYRKPLLFTRSFIFSSELNVTLSVCLSVCVSVCLSVCVCVCASFTRLMHGECQVHGREKVHSSLSSFDEKWFCSKQGMTEVISLQARNSPYFRYFPIPVAPTFRLRPFAFRFLKAVRVV